VLVVVVVGATVVVVVGAIVVVVVVVVVVTVVATSAKFASIVYEVPYHASGLPQQTPALRRYVPGWSCIEIFESSPYQSSFAASKVLLEL
jgi:hypothetical protein